MSMKSSEPLSEDFLHKAMENAVKKELHRLIEIHASEIEHQLARKVDQMVLNLASHYSIYQDQNRILIEVKKLGSS